MKIELGDLEAVISLDETHQRVVAVIDELGADLSRWARFLSWYTTWNSCFGSSVATLAGRVGASYNLFSDPQEPIASVADRSVLVASFFFDAARDEFDDRDTKHRDTHRCLAQALLKGFVEHARERDEGFAGQDLRALFDPPGWLHVLRRRVQLGYGAGYPEELEFLFRAMGYHLGSEVLADQEFSLLDEQLRARFPGLVEDLEQREVRIADQTHNAYYWLRIHSGHGGGAEADHFAWAVQGVEKAFRFVPDERHEDLRRQVLEGFTDFARDHQEFFRRALAA